MRSHRAESRTWAADSVRSASKRTGSASSRPRPKCCWRWPNECSLANPYPVCCWLEAEGVRTSGGNLWRPQVLRGALLNPRYQGLRTFNGENPRPPQWPALFPHGMGERLNTLLTDPKRRTNRSARRYLLSGMCRCSKCGNKMFSIMRYETRRYLCRSGPGFYGCGSVSITAGPIEEIIAEAVLFRLDTPELEAVLNGKALQAPHTTALQASVDADVAQLEELAQNYADRAVSAAKWIQARKTIEARLANTRKRLVSAMGAQDAFHYIGQGSALRSPWPPSTSTGNEPSSRQSSTT